MICCITYGDEKYQNLKHLNAWSAINKGLADKVVVYGPEDLDEDFRNKYSDILKEKRGGGYWLWKPYIVKKTLEQLNENDYLCYCDAGAVYLKNVRYLINALEKSNQSVMCFDLNLVEKYYTKRDAFVLMECDDAVYFDTTQRQSGFMIFKKSDIATEIVDKWFEYCKDRRIVSDDANTMDLKNYDGFIENRHDQTVWSLITKKYGILPFCDASTSKRVRRNFSKDVAERSDYPVCMDFHRNRRDELMTWSDYKKFRMKKRLKRIKKKFGKNS